MKTLGEVARTLTLLAVGMTGVVRATPSDWLFGNRAQSGCCQWLERLDPTTGSALNGWSFPSVGLAPFGLTYQSDRLVSINIQTSPDRILVYHPADASRIQAQTTGFNHQYVVLGLESHPTTGALYYATLFNLYTLHPTTGFATLVAPFSGFSFPQDGVAAIAIDANGQAIAIGTDDGATRHPIYQLNLATAQLTWIADLIINNGHGDYRDLAFSSTGELWASFYDVGINPAARGLYKIDTNSFLVTLVRPMDEPYFGLAFVPETAQATYCTAKANSLGCAPEISADGFPSPTATSGYIIRASNVRNRVAGSLAFTVAGRASTSLGGGTLCLATPLRKTGVRNSAGSPTPLTDCSGSWSLDFNTWMNQVVPLPAGVTVQAQWLGRDPGFSAPNNWTFSDALEFTMRL